MNETLLDLTKLRESVADVLGGSDDTVSLWFETMLHYSLVDTVSEQYHNFGEIGAATLMMLAKNRNITLNKYEAQEALKPIRSVPPYPEVPAALEKLKKYGFRMALLTNSSKEGMQAQLRNAGINPYFNETLNVEEIGKFKPHAEVYEWAARKLKISPKNCLFIAAHGWDVAGAAAAGMDTAFIARPGQALYPLSA
jgi:2-haloacid dehalogenase